LIVVAQQNGGRAELPARLGNARVHGMISKRKVIFQAAACVGRRSRFIIKNQIHSTPPSVQPALHGTCAEWRTGMLKAKN